MPRRIVETVSFEITLGDPLPLADLEQYRSALIAHGIYFIQEGRPDIAAFDPYSFRVVYIGKAIGETIYSRCHKHRAALLDERSSSGKPTMRPGRNFRAYRDSVGNSPDNLWATPGYMNKDKPYLISCAEEYFLHEYAQRNHSAGPRANTM